VEGQRSMTLITTFWAMTTGVPVLLFPISIVCDTALLIVAMFTHSLGCK
jgi:hypothetical protein